jgi:hypothetical protein
VHGTMTAIRNRKGRKRKSGRREPSGRLQRVVVDYRMMAGEQPHRAWLPEAHRRDERGGSILGCLNLLNRISEQQYEAGRRYSVIVGAYLSMANAPRGTAGSGRGYPCIGSRDCPPETCICLSRTQVYNRAYEAISREGGRPAHLAVNAVVINDHPCEDLESLSLGLSALAKHMGLTGGRK